MFSKDARAFYVAQRMSRGTCLFMCEAREKIARLLTTNSLTLSQGVQIRTLSSVRYIHFHPGSSRFTASEFLVPAIPAHPTYSQPPKRHWVVPSL